MNFVIQLFSNVIIIPVIIDDLTWRIIDIQFTHDGFTIHTSNDVVDIVIIEKILFIFVFYPIVNARVQSFN